MWLKMLRISQRLCASVYRDLLQGEKATRFLTEVNTRLMAAKSGEAETETRGELMSYWEEVHRQHAQWADKVTEARQLNDMIRETSDAELRALAEEDGRAAEEAADELSERLAEVIVPQTELDVLGKCQLEFTSGAGGAEAMLFTGELMEMYRKYSEGRGWQWSPLQVEDSSLGGVRSAVISVVGPASYAALRFEAGVHRVQRIPQTDKSRMHTSTSSIAVLPEPEEVSVIVPTEDVKIETMRASGPGGQNVNKRSTAVRLTHKATGIAVHCMDERFQHLNIQIAFKRLAAILMQQKVDAIYEKFTSDRKLQVGTKARAEKIRTYNFKDDRITDHRLHLNMGNMEDFLRGGEGLSCLIDELQKMDRDERLKCIIEQCIVE